MSTGPLHPWFPESSVAAKFSKHSHVLQHVFPNRMQEPSHELRHQRCQFNRGLLLSLVISIEQLRPPVPCLGPSCHQLTTSTLKLVVDRKPNKQVSNNGYCRTLIEVAHKQDCLPPRILPCHQYSTRGYPKISTMPLPSWNLRPIMFWKQSGCTIKSLCPKKMRICAAAARVQPAQWHYVYQILVQSLWAVHQAHKIRLSPLRTSWRLYKLPLQPVRCCGRQCATWKRPTPESGKAAAPAASADLAAPAVAQRQTPAYMQHKHFRLFDEVILQQPESRYAQTLHTSHNTIKVPRPRFLFPGPRASPTQHLAAPVRDSIVLLENQNLQQGRTIAYLVEEGVVLQVRLEALCQEAPQRIELHIARERVHYKHISAAQLNLALRHCPALSETQDSQLLVSGQFIHALLLYLSGQCRLESRKCQVMSTNILPCHPC